MKLFDELKWRGLINDISDDELIKELNEGCLTFYIGVDPTADSLHIGHCSSLLTAKRLSDAGHKPIMIAGGATGLIGDPKPDAERPMISVEDVENNIVKIKAQMNAVLECDIINNYDWHGNINFITFLRDYGKHINVNYMISKDSVKRRLETGITYTEFSYMLLQAVDFLKLYEQYNCRLQIGGQDQWGNITAGLEMIRKHHPGAKAYAFTMPLVTKADGTKFGKSEQGNVWLDATRTSPYEMYQFFINTEDVKVIDYLKIFTFLTKEEIEVLEQSTKEKPELREAAKALAKEMVIMIHGEDAYKEALKITEVLFSGEVNKLSSENIENIFKNHETTLIEGELPIIDLLVLSGVAKSKREARDLVNNGGISVNGTKVTDETFVVGEENVIGNKFVVIRKGKKNYFLAKFN